MSGIKRLIVKKNLKKKQKNMILHIYLGIKVNESLNGYVEQNLNF